MNPPQKRPDTLDGWQKAIAETDAKSEQAKRLWLWFIAACAVFIAIVVFVPPYFEMRAFNKFSRTKATYVDALFAQLRVMPDK